MKKKTNTAAGFILFLIFGTPFFVAAFMVDPVMGIAMVGTFVFGAIFGR